MVAEVLACLFALVGAGAVWYYRREAKNAAALLEAERRSSQAALAAAKVLADQQAAALKVLRLRHEELARGDKATAQGASGSARAASDLLNSLHKGR